MRNVFRNTIAAVFLVVSTPSFACDNDPNIRLSPLALPSDEALNIQTVGGVTMVAPDGCSGGLYKIVFPDILARANGGDARAMDQVGLMYSAGAGTKQDWKAAIAWLNKASAAGIGEADYRLAYMFHYGVGHDSDVKRAFDHYTTASEKGVAWASTNLGTLHMQGTGTPQNISEAVRYFELARKQGDPVATQNLAVINAQGGPGFPKDEKRAFALAREAAEQANIPALRLMGFFYANGIGIERDFERAYAWSAMAAKAGDKPATQIKAKLETVLDEASQRRATELAEKCIAANYKPCGV
jgi:TPR repeat protein